MPPRRPRPARAPGVSREAVFAAAAELFSARGFDGVGVDDIAHAAGVNKAMIYYHFADKLALYREVVRDMLRSVGAPRRRHRRRARVPPANARRLHRRHSCRWPTTAPGSRRSCCARSPKARRSSTPKRSP